MASRALTYPIVFDPSGARKGARDAERELERLNRAGKRAMGDMKVAGTAAAAGLAAVAVGAVKLGQSSVQAAIESEKAMARVKAMVEAAGVSWKQHGDQIERVIEIQSRKSGFDDEELASSFANLTRVTKDHNEALKLNALAMDLARGRGMNLAQASALIGRVASGANVSLARYGIVLDKNATTTQKLAAIQRQFAGQTEAYGRTTQGSIDKASVAWENLRETIGAKLAPVVSRFMRWVADTAIPTLEKWWPTIERVARTVGGALATAFIAIRHAAQRAWPAVRRAVEATVDWISKNVVPVVRGVVRGVQEAWERFGPVIKNAIDSAVRVLRPALQAIGRVINTVMAVLRGDWGKAWDNIKGVPRLALTAALNAIRGLVKTFLAAGRALGRAIYDGVRAALAGLKDMVRDAVNAALEAVPGSGALRRLLGLAPDVPFPDSLRGGGLPALLRSLPTRALGGVVPGRPPATPGDNMIIAARSGEVILTEQQQAMIGRGRIAQVLRMTGGVVGGSSFARGGLVAAEQFARAQVGEPYVWGGGHSIGDASGWDCSGFASNVAARVPGYRGGIVDTYTAWAMSKNNPSDGPIVWGFRSSNDRAGRGWPAHMGIRVNGTWFDAGSGGVEMGDSRWDKTRVPPGLEYLAAAASGGDRDTAPQGPPRRAPAQQPPRFRPLSKAVLNALRSGGGPEPMSLTDQVSSAIGAIGRDDSLQDKRNRTTGENRARQSISSAMPEGAQVNEDEVRLRGDLAVLAGRRKDALKKKGILTKALKRVRTAIRNLKKRKAALFKRLRAINAKTPNWQKKREALIEQIRGVNDSLTERWGEERGFRDQLADLAVELAELNEDIKDVTKEIEQTPDWITDEDTDTGSAGDAGAGGDAGSTDTSAPAPEAPNPEDKFNYDIAAAKGTPGTEDDSAALNAYRSYAVGQHGAAVAAGDWGRALYWLNVITGLDDSLKALTSATEANTEAIQAFTGSVAYSFRGQGYYVGQGRSQSSDSLLDVGVGM